MAGFSSIIGGCRNIYCDSPLRVSVSLHSIKGYGLYFLPAVENLHPQACPLDFVSAPTSTTTQDFDYLPRNPLDTD